MFTLGATTGYSAVYNLRGGTLNVNASTAIGNSSGTSTLNIDGGTLAVGAITGSVSADVLNLGSAAGYSGSHTLSGNRSLTAWTENVGKGGTGSLTQTGGNHTVVFDLCRRGPGGLGGTLAIDLISGFNPAAGDSFDVLLAEVLHGTFGTVLLPSLDPGLIWGLQYLLDPGDGDILRLNVHSEVPVPAAAWMFASAVLALGALRRRSGRG